MTKLAPEWVRTSDPVIRSPARYRWTTAPAYPLGEKLTDKKSNGIKGHSFLMDLNFSYAESCSNVDNRLIKIKRPWTISRVPRSISDHLKYWKASEYRSWLNGLILCLRSLLPHTSGWERWSQSFTEMRSIEVKDAMIIARGLMCEVTMTKNTGLNSIISRVVDLNDRKSPFHSEYSCRSEHW